MGVYINQLKSEQIESKLMLVVEERGKLEYQGKTSGSRVENQQTQPTYGIKSRNQSL